MTSPEPGARQAITPAMRDGIQYAIKRLEQLALAVHGHLAYHSEFAVAARALREELKIADPGRTT